MSFTDKFSRVINNSSYFRICFVICSFFQMITYLDYLSYVATGIAFFWGVYLIIRQYLIHSKFRKVDYSFIFILFTVMSVATILINIASHPFSTAVSFFTMIVNLIYFYLFFCRLNEDVVSIRKEIYKISKCIAILTSVCAIIGLVLLVIFHRAIWLFDRSLIIFENRFKGIYINPNPMAFASVCGMISCFALRCKGFLQRVEETPVRLRWICICVGLNGLSLMLSVSNSGLLLICSFIFGLICYSIFAGKKFTAGRTVVYKTSIFLLCCALVSVSLFGLRYVVNYVSGVLISGEPMVSGEVLQPTAEQYKSELQTSDGTVTFEHINGTIDSGRIKLYKRALNEISKQPVFGVGYGNIFYNGWMEKGELFDYHNGYLTLGVSNGVISFAIFFLFAVLLARRMTSVVFKLKLQGSSSVLPHMMCFIYAYCIYSCVEPTLLFYPSFTTLYFWWCIGSAYALVKNFEKTPQMVKN